MHSLSPLLCAVAACSRHTVTAASVVFPCRQCHELRLQWLLHRAGSIVRTVRTMHSVSSLLSRAATSTTAIPIAVARTRGWRVRGKQRPRRRLRLHKRRQLPE